MTKIEALDLVRSMLGETGVEEKDVLEVSTVPAQIDISERHNIGKHYVILMDGFVWVWPDKLNLTDYGVVDRKNLIIRLGGGDIPTTCTISWRWHRSPTAYSPLMERTLYGVTTWTEGKPFVGASDTVFKEETTEPFVKALKAFCMCQ